MPSITNQRSSFVTVNQGPIRGMAQGVLAAQITDWEPFVASLDAREGQLQREGGGQGITSRRDVLGFDAFIKVYPPSDPARRLRDLTGSLRCVREWELNCRVESLGFHTAPILAALARRVHWLGWRHYLVTLPSSELDVRHAIIRNDLEGPYVTGLVRRLGQYVADLHRRGLGHAHLHCKHIFIRGEDEAFSLIDLENMVIRDPLPSQVRRRNLRQMRQSLLRHGNERLAQLFQQSYEAGLRGAS